MIRGAQDLWVAGADILFRRAGAANDDIIDLGTITAITPQFDITKITLDDPRDGQLTTVLDIVSKFTEAYNFDCANFSPDLLAIVFNADPAETWSQSNAPLRFIQHTLGTLGRRIKLLKDASTKEFVYNLDEVTFVTLDKYAITAVNTGTKTFTIAGDHVTEFNVPGLKIGVGGCGTLTDGLFTVVSASLVLTNTEIIVSEVITGATATGNLGKAFTLDVDYEVDDLGRATIKTLEGGAMVAGSIYVTMIPNAVTSGPRLIYPQTGGGAILGTAIITFGRDGGAQRSFRECEISLAPAGLSLSAEQASTHQLTATVLSDKTKTIDPAGRLLYAQGDLPDLG